MPSRIANRVGLALVVAGMLGGTGLVSACTRGTDGVATTVATDTPTTGAAAAPSASTSVARAEVPSGDGPGASVSGTITVKGDPAPEIASIAPRIPLGKCFSAHQTYAKLFREGAGRTLADVLVAVTEYQGEVPEPPPVVHVEGKDCSYDRRTIALTLGQKLSVRSAGKESYTPQLVGHPTHALILAVPGGDPVEVTPEKLGQYQLVDRTHPYIFTDVFVLQYSSVAVTQLDGKFRISGLPAGRAKLSALLPITGQTLEREIQLPEGGNLTVDLEFDFDDARDGAKARAKPGDDP